MRIFLLSHAFLPSVGGVETVSKVLAEEFVRMGHSVIVGTFTKAPEPEIEAPYRIVRSPSRSQLRSIAEQSDIVFQNQMALRTLLPLIFMRKPIFVTQQTWLAENEHKVGIRNYVARMFLWRVHNISISSAIAKALWADSNIIGNPFEMHEFEDLPGVSRDLDILFMGRLVKDKGCDLLIQSIADLKAEGITPSVTIIGDGRERQNLEDMAHRLEVADQVSFMGFVREGRGALVARHRVMVVPSRWAEPFGVVALEGIASGCVLVASSKGGLADAVGECGLLFSNGDGPGLTNALRRVLTDPELRRQLLSKRPEHIEKFKAERVAQQYIQVFERCL